ncbi:uncharacterized protein TRIADDRAFT_59731 [Trichoplax adhaerens]|uniref:SAM domain-containing protein n=1 Tax=Trichoplax adhaerens TaxID=10228 RepID=B3S6A0_TRIAD|nr:hypothetical protein TRIADDRAFT_59731 [Trichoplax adhaerens]EDV21720.1 hypothetical protein TRIADDRAFT_59731 [Trichoplax adhaerens]|eukprot:XP_002115868.1 hypothetical protein TRIADDRAFT_59731 [Trichoplax adhaerens]
MGYIAILHYKYIVKSEYLRVETSPAFQSKKGYQVTNDRDGLHDNDNDNVSGNLPRLSSIGRHSLRLSHRLKTDQESHEYQEDKSKNDFRPNNQLPTFADKLRTSPLTDLSLARNYSHLRALPNHDNPTLGNSADNTRNNNSSNLLRLRTQSDLGTDNKQLRRRYKPFTLSTQKHHFNDDDNHKNLANHARSHSGSSLERLSQRRAQYRENVDLDKSAAPIASEIYLENSPSQQPYEINADESIIMNGDENNKNQYQLQQHEGVVSISPSLESLTTTQDNNIQHFDKKDPQEEIHQQHNTDTHHSKGTTEIEENNYQPSFKADPNEDANFSSVHNEGDNVSSKPTPDLESLVPSLLPSHQTVDSVDDPMVPPKLPSSPPPLIPSQLVEKAEQIDANVANEKQDLIKANTTVNTASVRSNIGSPLSSGSQSSSYSPFRSAVSPFSDSSQECPKLNIDKPLIQWTPSDVGNWLTSVGLDAMKRRFTTNKIDGKELEKMTKEKLEQIGVRYAMLRDKIMDKIMKLRSELIKNKPKPVEKSKEEVSLVYPKPASKASEMSSISDLTKKERKPIAISPQTEIAPPLPETPPPSKAPQADMKSVPTDLSVKRTASEQSDKSAPNQSPTSNENTSNQATKPNSEYNKTLDSDNKGLSVIKKPSLPESELPSSQKKSNFKVDDNNNTKGKDESSRRAKKTFPTIPKKVKGDDVSQESTIHLENVILRFNNENRKDLATVAASAGAEAAAIAARRFGLFFNKVDDAKDKRHQKRMARLSSNTQKQNQSFSSSKKDARSATTTTDNGEVAPDPVSNDYTCVSRNIAVKNPSYEVISSLEPDDDALRHPNATVAGQLLLIDDKYYYVPLSSPRSPHQLSHDPFNTNTSEDIPVRDKVSAKSESPTVNELSKETNVESNQTLSPVPDETIDPLIKIPPKPNRYIKSMSQSNRDSSTEPNHDIQTIEPKSHLVNDFIEKKTINNDQQSPPDLAIDLSELASQNELDKTLPSLEIDSTNKFSRYSSEATRGVIPLDGIISQSISPYQQHSSDISTSELDRSDNDLLYQQSNEPFANYFNQSLDDGINKQDSQLNEATPKLKNFNSELPLENSVIKEHPLQLSTNEASNCQIRNPISEQQDHKIPTIGSIYDHYQEEIESIQNEDHDKDLNLESTEVDDKLHTSMNRKISIPIKSMNSDDVSLWLNSIGLPEIAAICEDNAINGKDIQNLGSKLFEHPELNLEERREVLATEIYFMNNKPDRENSELHNSLKEIAKNSNGSDKVLALAILEVMKSPPWCHGVDVDIDFNNKNILNYSNGTVTTAENNQTPFLESNDDLKHQNGGSSPYAEIGQVPTSGGIQPYNSIPTQSEFEPKVVPSQQNIENQNNLFGSQPVQEIVNTTTISDNSATLNSSTFSTGNDSDLPSHGVPSSPPIRSGANLPLYMQQNFGEKQDKSAKNKKKKITTRISKIFKPGTKSSNDDKKKVRSQSQEEDNGLLRIDASILHRGQSVPGPSYKGFKVAPQINCLQVIENLLEKYEVHTDPKTYYISQESLDQTVPAVELNFDDYPLPIQMKWPKNSKLFFELKRKLPIIKIQMQMMLNDQPSDQLTTYEVSTSTTAKEITQQQLKSRKVDIDNLQDWCLVELTHGGNRIFDEEECLHAVHHQNVQVLLLKRSKLRSTSSSLSSSGEDVELILSKNNDYPPANSQERPITIPVNQSNIAFIQKLQKEMNDSPTLEKLLAEINQLRNIVTALQKRAALAIENSIISTNAKVDLENAQQIHSQELDDKQGQIDKLKAVIALKDKEIQQLQNSNKSKGDQLTTLTGERDRALRLLQKYATGNDITERLQGIQVQDDAANHTSLNDKNKNELIKDLQRKEREKEFLQVYVNNILSVICEEAPQLLESINRLQSSRL